MSSILIKKGKICAEDKVLEGDLLIVDGVIANISEDIDFPADQIIEAHGNYVLPGGVDGHTHMNLPTNGTHASDDFTTGTKAALFGGTTTIIDFANQVRGETLRKTVDDWYAMAEGKVYCDYGLHLTVTDVNDNTMDELASIVEKDGITSFKSFLAYDHNYLTVDQMKRLMIRAKELNCMVTTHSELKSILDPILEKLVAEHRLDPKDHPVARPNEAEAEAVKVMMTLAEETGCISYIVHTSTHEAVELIRAAKKKGLHVYGETCPQYLLLTDEKYDQGDFTEESKYMMSPPLRKEEDNKALFNGIIDGTIDVIGTDHCPFMLSQKEAGRGDFRKMPMGAPGVEDRFELIFTEGVENDKFDVQKFVDVISTNPAKIFGLYPKKGVLKVGSDGDVVIFDPTRVHDLHAVNHHMNVDYNCYEGRVLKGEITHVIKGGVLAVQGSKFLLTDTNGKYLKRGLCKYA